MAERYLYQERLQISQSAPKYLNNDRCTSRNEPLINNSRG
jgi:hypothetical protein